MRRAWILVAAGIAMLAVIDWVVAVRDSTSATPIGPAAAAAHAAAGASADTAVTVPIELLLLPDAGIGAVPGSVRIGLGRVLSDNAASAPVDLEAEQSGPRRHDELTTVERWISMPGQLLPDGRVRVGPLRMPRAERYTLQARGEDGLRFYAASFEHDDVPATIGPLVGAGIRVHVQSPDTRVLLRRLETSPSSAVWQRLQKWIVPDLLEAFSEHPLPVRNRQVLAPFAPGSVEIVLEVNGVEAERRQVSLKAGQVEDVRFDPVNEAVARAVSTDLELEFVDQSSGESVPALEVSWLSGRMLQVETTDRHGRVTFEGLDRQQDHEFSLASRPSPGQLPTWPELRPLQVTSDDLAAYPEPAETTRHRVELAPLRWLIALPPASAARIERNRRSPYPIHVLQRQREGQWRDTAADHFIDTPDGLAVSVTEPGTYRCTSSYLSPHSCS